VGYPCSGMNNNTAYRLTFGSAVFVSGAGKILHKKKPPEQGGQRVAPFATDPEVCWNIGQEIFVHNATSQLTPLILAQAGIQTGDERTN